MIAFQAVLITILFALAVGAVIWMVLVRPLMKKAEDVIERADESYEVQMQRESLSEQEREQAEQELNQIVGQGPEEPRL
ncbi:MAG: hypothetical protein JNM34_06595 [Chthonomonadaceae bacterium]|nr:hypothetical protein [Chthonomonadaceae bacterium]